MNSMRNGLYILLIAFLAGSLSAVRTENRILEGFNTFNKGEFRDVGITHDGKLFPSPSLTEFAKLPSPIVWETALMGDGSLIVSTGNNGTVYRVLADGESEVLFQPEESLSRALVVDEKGRVYIGTSPKGRIYRILEDGSSELFFDPTELYIWDMVIGPDGYLYVATGGRGKIYKLSLSYRLGEDVSPLYEASETHINTIAFNANGELVIGTGPGGNLYKVSPDGESVEGLFHAGAEEVKGIYPQADGSVVFSTFSTKSSGASDSSSNDSNNNSQNPFQFTVFANDLPEYNGLMRLDPEGNLETIWSLNPHKIFSVYPLETGEWFIGSGTNGRLFKVKDPFNWSNLLTVPSGGEITQIVPMAEAGGYYVIASNPARIYTMRNEVSTTSRYTSEVVDVGKTVKWGNLRYLSVNGTFENHVTVSTRTGNIEDPNRSWSDWSPLNGRSIVSNNSRFIQYRLDISAESPGVQRVQIFYQEQNLAPRIGQIRILPGAYRMYTAPKPSQTVTFTKVFQAGSNDLDLGTNRVPQLILEKEEAAVTAVWMPSDPNRDRMLYDLFVRKVGDEDWILAAKEINEPLYAMDIRGLEEGFYQLKIVAKDKLDNTAEDALTFEKASDPFLIDFTSPAVMVESIEIVGRSANVKVSVEDRFGVIERTYYSLNGENLQRAIPTDGLFDAELEQFDIQFSELELGTYSLIMQAYDENGNVGISTSNFIIE